VPTHADPVRIVVIEEHPLTRIGLVSVLQAERDLMVVGAAADVTGGLALIERWAPDAVLMNPDLTETDGPTAVRVLRSRVPGLRILALGRRDGDEEVHRIIEAGVSGYVLESSPTAEIVAAVREVHAGRSCLSPRVRKILDDRRQRPEVTPRERQVLALVAEGRCNAEIATILGISHGTVKLHMKSLLAKLGVEDRAQAALVALRRGFARMP
jgi:two-component system NarL family response regulator